MSVDIEASPPASEMITAETKEDHPVIGEKMQDKEVELDKQDEFATPG